MEWPGEQLLGKMWESLIDKGVGGLLTPWSMRRKGRAAIEIKAEEIVALAQAEKEAAEIRAGRRDPAWEGPLLLLADTTAAAGALLPAPAEIRALRFERAEAIRREVNTAKAVLAAEDILATDPTPPPSDAPAEDWLYRWREHASSVSSDDMQKLWGSVLAGETKKPGRYGLRTLDFLKNLSQEEAHLIESVATYIVVGRIWKSERLDKRNVTFDKLMILQDLRLISGVDGTGMQSTFTAPTQGPFQVVLPSHNKAIVAIKDEANAQFAIPVYLLSKLGIEVFGLCNAVADDEYLHALGKLLSRSA